MIQCPKMLDESGDKKLSIYVCLYILSTSLNTAIKIALPISGTVWNIISYSFGIIIAISFIIALPVLFQRNGRVFIISEAVFILMYAISFVMGEAESSLLKTAAMWTLGVCIPMGIAGISIIDKTMLFRYMQTISFIEFPILCMALLKLKDVGLYDMSTSYNMILPVTFFFYQFSKTNNIFSLLMGLIGLILIFLFGARGPVVCIALYVFVKVFANKRNSKTLLLRLLILLIIVVIVLFWNSILKQIQIFLNNNNINSYVLNRMIDGQITETSGRDGLWKYYIDMVLQRPLVGYGFKGGWISSGLGPHNMIIELFLTFGVVVGGIVSIYFTYLFLISIFKRSGINGDILLILGSYNFTMFFVSGNWLEKPLLFLFTALAISSKVALQKTYIHNTNDLKKTHMKYKYIKAKN